jgi:parallel beta-helix repeat protein
LALDPGCTNTGAQIQQALDSAYALGGGTVYLSPGVYCVDAPVIVRSRVYLIGAGVGATVLRGKSGNYTSGTVVDGAEVYATIAAVAADGASIRDLTVDHATNGTYANGISLLPKGAGYTGTPCTRCVVENVQVLGAGNLHTYMIWNLRGRYIKIVNNWVDGGITTYAPGSPQEGIESFGGTNVLISGNTVQNVGNAGLNLGSAGLQDSGIIGISAVDNYITNCGIGVNVFPTYDGSTGSQKAANTHIKNNVIIGAWSIGILGTTRELTVNSDLQIRGNTVKNVGTTGQSGIGIFLNGNPNVAVTPGTVVSNTISENHVENTTGRNGIGIAIANYPNARIIGNTITSSGHTGIYCYVAHDGEVSGNRVVDSTYYGILAYLSKRPTIKNNYISRWANLGGAAGISVQISENAVVQGNSFYFENTLTDEPSAVRVEETLSPAVVADNTLLFSPKYSYPFVNLSKSPNRGKFQTTLGLASVTVNNTLVTPNSRLAVTQTSGDPIPFTVASGLGYFIVTLATPSTSGAEVFSYEISP